MKLNRYTVTQEQTMLLSGFLWFASQYRIGFHLFLVLLSSYVKKHSDGKNKLSVECTRHKLYFGLKQKMIQNLCICIRTKVQILRQLQSWSKYSRQISEVTGKMFSIEKLSRISNIMVHSMITGLK